MAPDKDRLSREVALNLRPLLNCPISHCGDSYNNIGLTGSRGTAVRENSTYAYTMLYVGYPEPSYACLYHFQVS
jgi:hypothetical protein